METMNNYHTYFVSYVETKDGVMKFDNGVFGTDSSGVQLAKDSIRFVEQECPGAVLLNISKLD